MFSRHRTFRLALTGAAALMLVVFGTASFSGSEEPGTDARVAALEGKLESMSATLAQIQKDQREVLASMRRIEGQLKAAGSRRKAPPAPTGPVDIEIGKSPMKGDTKAAVTIVEFSDFQCPYCSRVQPMLEQVLAAYPDGGVKIVFKQFPLDSIHKQARPAALASLAAHQQGKFWEMHDALFANARSLSDDFYRESAEKIGLDMKRFEKDLARKDLASIIDEEIAQGRKAGVRGTPTLFMNGMRVTDRSLEGMKTSIDAALAKSKS